MKKTAQKYRKKSGTSRKKNSFADLDTTVDTQMDVLSTVKSIQEEVFTQKKQHKTIGFVPTMGALHSGHISLVEQAKTQCDYVIVSIFVNPTQFNNAADLQKYPRTLEADAELLKQAEVDLIFAPEINEIYPADYSTPTIDLGILDKVMEGKFRPGHFQGVVEVVKRFFDIVQPDFAYFGKKDFQQVAVIKYMTNYFQLPVSIVECPIIRSEKGLALSSRNMRLTDEEKEKALVLYNTLDFAKSNVSNFSPKDLADKCTKLIADSELKLEYLEIVDPASLENLENEWVDGATCCIAAYCGEVRLIDNMELVPIK